MAEQVLRGNKGANNIFSEMSPNQFFECRKIMVQAILATDMSQHMHHCAEVAEYASRAKALRNGANGINGMGGGVMGGRASRRVSMVIPNSSAGRRRTVTTACLGSRLGKKLPATSTWVPMIPPLRSPMVEIPVAVFFEGLGRDVT